MYRLTVLARIKIYVEQQEKQNKNILGVNDVKQGVRRFKKIKVIWELREPWKEK